MWYPFYCCSSESVPVFFYLSRSTNNILAPFHFLFVLLTHPTRLPLKYYLPGTGKPSLMGFYVSSALLLGFQRTQARGVHRFSLTNSRANLKPLFAAPNGKVKLISSFGSYLCNSFPEGCRGRTLFGAASERRRGE